jgi:hypothetical protein
MKNKLNTNELKKNKKTVIISTEESLKDIEPFYTLEKVCANCKHLKSKGWCIGCEISGEDKSETYNTDTCDKFEYDNEEQD